MGEELDSFSAEGGESFLIGLLRGSRVEEVCDLAMIEWADQLPHE